MRSKAPLLLMEQLVMLLVFALAAALCMQAFVQSDRISRESTARDQAVTAAQTAAEVLRHTGGDFARAAALLGTGTSDTDSLTADYDADWQIAGGTMRYTLGAARVDSGVDGLGMAEIWVRDEAADEASGELFRMRVAWQEADGGGE